MPPLPTIADTFRCTLNGASYQGVTPHCVFHVQTDSGDVTEIGERLDDAASTNSIWLPVHAAHNPTSIDILPLDGVSPTAIVPWTSTITGGTGDIIPEMAAVVSLRTSQRGPRGRGRQFIGPMTEGTNDDGLVDPTVRDNLQDAWAAWYTDLATGSPAIILSVASYTHSDVNGVASITVDQNVGTQRRRLLQQR